MDILTDFVAQNVYIYKMYLFYLLIPYYKFKVLK